MAITKSAKKAFRVSKRRRVFNLRKKDELKTAVKDVKRLITAGKKEEATKALSNAFKKLDKSSKTGLIKKGNASRRKSRLSKAISKIK